MRAARARPRGETKETASADGRREAKRARHNSTERERVDRCNEAFAQLGAMLPPTPVPRTKVNVLRTAGTLIEELRAACVATEMRLAAALAMLAPDASDAALDRMMMADDAAEEMEGR